MPVTTVSVSSSVVFGVYRNVLQCLRQLRHGSQEAPSAKLDIFLSGLAGGVAQVTSLTDYYTVYTTEVLWWPQIGMDGPDLFCLDFGPAKKRSKFPCTMKSIVHNDFYSP